MLLIKAMALFALLGGNALAHATFAGNINPEYGTNEEMSLDEKSQAAAEWREIIQELNPGSDQIAANGRGLGGAHRVTSCDAVGMASFYHEPQPTASGERFIADGITAAHRSLPFGTRVRVTYLATGRSVVVRINDRGPYVGGRIIDLSRGAARAIGMVGAGVGRVRLSCGQG